MRYKIHLKRRRYVQQVHKMVSEPTVTYGDKHPLNNEFYHISRKLISSPIYYLNYPIEENVISMMLSFITVNIAIITFSNVIFANCNSWQNTCINLLPILSSNWNTYTHSYFLKLSPWTWCAFYRDNFYSLFDPPGPDKTYVHNSCIGCLCYDDMSRLDIFL